MSYEARSVARLVAAVLLVFLLGLPAFASAQSTYQDRFAKAENVIRAHEPIVASWEQDSQITLAMGLTIAALGIAVIVLQSLPGRRARPATLAAGALVAVMALLSTTFFNRDAGLPNARAREGRTLIASAGRFIALAPSLPTDRDREEALGYIQQSAEALALLASGGSKGRPIATANQSSSAFPSPFATLYAAGSGCACAALAQPDTSAYRYFCGQGTAPSLTDARAAATEEALAQANMAVRKGQSKLPAGDLASYLRGVSAEVAACPIGGTRGFTMFVLLRVPTILTSASAQQAFNPPSSTLTTRRPGHPSDDQTRRDIRR
jgi:hypothetical protein